MQLGGPCRTVVAPAAGPRRCETVARVQHKAVKLMTKVGRPRLNCVLARPQPQVMQQHVMHALTVMCSMLLQRRPKVR